MADTIMALMFFALMGMFLGTVAAILEEMNNRRHR